MWSIPPGHHPDDHQVHDRDKQQQAPSARFAQSLGDLPPDVDRGDDVDERHEYQQQPPPGQFGDLRHQVQVGDVDRWISLPTKHHR